MKNSKGITVIESIVSISISIIAALGGYTLLASVQDTVVGNSEVTQSQQEARAIVERIARELRESSANRVWTNEDLDCSDPMIVFLTPRDGNRRFRVDAFGRPDWQRAIMYRLDPDLNRLIR